MSGTRPTLCGTSGLVVSSHVGPVACTRTLTGYGTPGRAEPAQQQAKNARDDGNLDTSASNYCSIAREGI
eukprot:scaffold283352_cov17-Prasinocladus_malaysianus.AAC.1